jgi:hypothetical protein
LRGWDETLLSKKVDQLATIVNRMNEEKGPDLLGICEVENRSVLDRLKEKIDSVGRRNYDVIHADTQDERGIDVAFLYDKTKFEVEPEKVFFHTIVKRVATREIVQVNFKSKATGNRLVLVGNHWPSRMGGQLESDNINAKINPNYENFLVALTAKSGNPLKLKPKAEGEAKEATITKKEDGELKGKVLARTRIELDGDIALILPTNRNEIDAEVLQLHKTNVDVAVQNYRLFVNAIFDVLKIAVNLTQRCCC